MKSSQQLRFFEDKKKQNTQKITIRNLIVIGDSISDRGIFYSGERLGTQLTLSFNMISKTPSGRFTNGLTWVDYLATNLINQFTIKELLNHKLNHDHDYLDLEIKQNHSNPYINKPDDIADYIVANNKRVKKAIYSYSLNDPREIAYHHETFVRSYSEAGLCNHNFGLFTKSIKTIVTRLIVPYLSDKVSDIKQDDAAYIKRNKEQTLSIIWSGMNDICLINDATEVRYRRKIRFSLMSIKKNIRSLIESGYSHFLLCNLPDVTLSPRYKTTPKDKLETLQRSIASYNFNLRRILGEFKYRYPDCSFDLYDTHALLKNLYTNPGHYGLDDTKIDTTYVSSPDFKPISKRGDIQHSPGYLFWDEVHPTTYVHTIIAREMEKFLRLRYLFKPPIPSETETCQKNSFSI